MRQARNYQHYSIFFSFLCPFLNFDRSGSFTITKIKVVVSCFVIVKQLGSGIGNRKVTPVPGDDSIILGATHHHLPPNNFNHEVLLEVLFEVLLKFLLEILIEVLIAPLKLSLCTLLSSLSKEEVIYLSGGSA